MLEGDDTMLDANGPAHHEAYSEENLMKVAEYDPYDPMNLMRIALAEEELDRAKAKESCCRPDIAMPPPPPPEPLCLTVNLEANKVAAKVLKRMASDDSKDDHVPATKHQREDKPSNRRLDYGAVLETSQPMPDSLSDQQGHARLTTDRRQAKELNSIAVSAHERLQSMFPLPSAAEDYMRPCTLSAWHERVRCAGQLDRLEGALLAYVRNNPAWSSSMWGVGNADGFAPGHPCEGMPDATRLTLEKLETIEPIAYIKAIEDRFRFSLNVSLRVASTHTMENSKSIVTRFCATVLPSLDPASLHGILNEPLLDGPWRITNTPIVDLAAGQSADVPRALHANSTDLAVAARHPYLLKALCEPLARIPHPTLFALDSIGDWITRKSKYKVDEPLSSPTRWRSDPSIAPFLAAMIARLSCLPIPTLDDLGEAGKWWMGDKDESLQERAIRHHTARSQMAIVLARKVNELLQMPLSRYLRETDGLGKLCHNVSEMVRIWFSARLVNIPTLYLLYASWMAYMFSPQYSTLEYVPMSFANRHIDTKSPNVVRIANELKAMHGKAQGTKLAQNKFKQHTSNNLAMGLFQDQWEYSTAATGSGNLKRLAPRDFTFSVWHPHLGDPRAGNKLFTPESITIATFYRSYNVHRERTNLVKFTNAGPSAPSVAISIAEAVKLGRHPFYPPDVYTDALHQYLDECLDKKGCVARAVAVAKRYIGEAEKEAERLYGESSESVTTERKLVVLNGCKEIFEKEYLAKPTKQVGRFAEGGITFVHATELACEKYLSDRNNIAMLLRLRGRCCIPTVMSAASALRKYYDGVYKSSTHVFFQRVKD